MESAADKEGRRVPARRSLLWSGLFIVVLTLASPLDLGAATIYWNSPEGGSWNLNDNWSPPQVPGPADDAVVNLDGTYTVTMDLPATVASLSFGALSGTQILWLRASTLTLTGAGSIGVNGVFKLDGGTLDGPGTLTLDGDLVLSSGTMAGAGGVTSANGDVLIGGGTSVRITQRLLTTAGTTTWGASHIHVDNGGRVQNTGTWTVTSNFTLQNPFGGTALFSNAGTFRKSAGSGSTTVSTPMNNSGLIDAQLTSTIRLSGGGTHTGAFSGGGSIEFGGAHQFDSGSRLAVNGTTRFTSGTVTFNPGSSLSSSGTTEFGADSVVLNTSSANPLGNAKISSGHVTVIEPLNVAGSLTMSSGIMEGSGSVSVAGPLLWSGGRMSGAGVTNANGGVVFDGFLGATLVERLLITSGTTTWASTNMSVSSGGRIHNTGTWNITEDRRLFSSPGNLFTNDGALRKTAGSGSTEIDIPMDNVGLVESLAGELSFRGAYTQSAGATRLAGGAIRSLMPLQIAGGSFEGSGTFIGSLVTSGRTVPGLLPNPLTITGSFTQSDQGILDFDIGDTGTGVQYGRLAVTGTGAATLAGTLRASLTGGYTPVAGDTFVPMTYTSRTGVFTRFSFPNLGGGLGWSVEHNTDHVLLRVISGTCLDNDADGSAVCGGPCILSAGHVCGDCNDANAAINPTTAEICDTVDNNCDGSIDEGNPEGGAACSTGETGVCDAGTVTCEPGGLICRRNGGPGPEVCNGVDDDCDGTLDEIADSDGDGMENCLDNCPDAFNAPTDCDGSPVTPDEQCDTDGDGQGDVCDCQPLDPIYPLPIEVGDTILVTEPAGQTSVAWSLQPQVSRYHVYRGQQAPGSPWAYNQQCLVGGTQGPAVPDPLDPPSSAVFYYLVSSTCGPGLESNLGRSSTPGGIRPQPFTCPDAALDADRDGTEEAADTCPGFQNPTQSDVDGDGHGDVCDNCPLSANPGQQDTDHDGAGDACDPT